MPGSFLRRTIQEGSKTTTAMLVQLSAGRKATSCSTSVKSVVNGKNGKLTSCHRVRKESTKMTIEHRKRYINAYKLASVHPLFKKNYEKTVALHLNESDEARLPEVFLPWHRWYLTEFENLLRRIDCRVTIPFWDWSKNTHHWWRTLESWGSRFGRRWKQA